MTLQEIQNKYDWDKYCIVIRHHTPYAEHQAYENIKDFLQDLDLKYLDDNDLVTIQVYCKSKINEALPSPNQLIDNLQDDFDDFTGGEYYLNTETEGLKELKQAYETYLNKNQKWWWASLRVGEAQIFTVKTLKEFKEKNKN